MRNIIIMFTAYAMLLCLSSVCQEAESKTEIHNIDELASEIKKHHSFFKENFPYQGKEWPMVRYLLDHQEAIPELEKKLPEDVFSTFMGLFGKWLAKTNVGDMFACKYAMKRYESEYDSPLLKKYWLLHFALGYGLGMKPTLDLIEYAENKYPPPLTEVFKNRPEYIDRYKTLKTSIKRNISLFEELKSISEDDMDEWYIYTFSYAHSKLMGPPVPDDERPEKTDSPLRNFLGDFCAVYNIYQRDTMPKIRKEFEKKELVKLFQALVERGGKNDYMNVKIVHHINRVNHGRYLPGFGASDYLKLTLEEFNKMGIMSVQSVIEDKEGRIKYFFSFANGKWPEGTIAYFRSSIYKHTYTYPWLFYFAKIIYEDEKPVDMVSTEIYATPEIKKMLNDTVRAKYNIDFSSLFSPLRKRDKPDGSALRFCYDISAFHQSIRTPGKSWPGCYYWALQDMPTPPDEKPCWGKMGSVSARSHFFFPKGTYLIPESTDD